MAGCADPAGLPKLAETQVWGGSFDALAGLRFPEAVGERFQAWRFPEAPLAEGHFPDCPELGRHVPTFRLPVGRLPLSQFRPLFLVRSIRSTANFPVEAQKWRFRWWIRKVVSTWTEEDAHFPGATFRLDMRQSSWNSRVIFRAPLSGARVCYDEYRKVFNEMAHFPTRDFPAKKLQEGLPERGFNSLSGGHFPPGIQY